MARVDYYGLEVALQERILADSELENVTVFLEKEVVLEREPVIGIYLLRRQAPGDLQTISAGQRTKFLVEFAVWCYAMSLDSVAEACRIRDDLIGKVELALMRDRTLNAHANVSWLDGGEFRNAAGGEGEGDFMSAAEVRVVVEVTAVT